MSTSGKFQSSTVTLTDQSTQWSVGAGMGADFYIRKRQTIPLLAPIPPGLALNRGSAYSTPNLTPTWMSQGRATIQSAVSSGGTGAVFPGMPNFRGTYDFGSAGVYNFGTQSWTSTPSKSNGK